MEERMKGEQEAKEGKKSQAPALTSSKAERNEKHLDQ